MGGAGCGMKDEGRGISGSGKITLQRSWLIVSTFAALIVAPSGPALNAQPAGRPNILLVTLDTIRADRIGAYGYQLAETPHLDMLAAEGVRFDDATSQAPLTGPSHAAILTGQYPGRFGIRNNASTPLPEATLTLAERLKAAGYATGAFIGAFVVDRAYGFGQGFDIFDAAFEGFRHELKGQVQRPAGKVVDPALAWINAVSVPSPFFAWVHLYDAHAPYSAPAPYGPRFKARPYDGEVAYVDAQVGRLVAALRASSALDRTIVTVIGDHGEALGDHGEADHGIFLYESVMRIPWIMRLPPSLREGHTAGVVVTRQARSIDLLPTLLELAGVRDAAPVDGESLAGRLRGEPPRDPAPSYAETWYPQLHFGWSRLRSLRVGEWKYIDAPHPELYDLRTDRSEQRNVVAERANVAARMASELDGIEKGFGAAATAAAPQPDAETIARLRSLGYVGLAAPSSGSGRGPDPKDKIAELATFRELLTRAGDDIRTGRTDAAIASLKRALAINERAYDAHVMLGSAWQQKGDFEKAVGEFEAAALLNPVGAAPHLLAANAFFESGRLESAMSRVDRAAGLEPDSGEIASMRGRIFERAGRGAEALAAYERAVTFNGADMASRGRLAGIAMNMGRHDLAEPQLRILLESKYQPSRTHFALGKLAQARGRKAEAAAHYREALRLEPGFPPAREALRLIADR
ncbi:MAG: sulfatase-like hydrolase/transferase [Acidobacteria bacterium]|nr:sulfatase-like hydrolase/transferase [Acidobacteriota bacterium]